MFQHSYQSGGFLEVFHTKTDKEKDKAYDKLYKVTNAAGFKKVYDKVTKGYIYELDGIRSSLHFPSNDKQDLGLIQPFLVLQVYLPMGSPFSVEVTITDTLKNKRRLHFSTGIRQLEKNYFHAKVPLDVVKRGVWMNLSFDLLSFFELFKGQTFRSIDSFTIGAVCKIRRIFTMKGPIADFSCEDDLINPQSETKMVPKTQNFTPGVTYANQLISLDLIKSVCAPFQQEESMIEESTTSIPQGTKPKTAAAPTKQPLGPTNTKKDTLQSFKSPQPQAKAKPTTMVQKSVKPQENTERIETVARGKENIRENTAPILGQRRKIEQVVAQRKELAAASLKPSNTNNEEFEDEKLWKNAPKPYKKGAEQKSRITELPSQQDQPDSSSPESSQVSNIPTSRDDDYEEQKQDTRQDFKSSFGISSRASTAKALSLKNPWAAYSSTSVEQNLKKVDPQENTASLSTMDTRKNLENTDPRVLEDTKTSEVQDRQTTLEEDAEFSSIWRKIVAQDQGVPANVKSPGNWENAFEAKDLGKFSPLKENEDADEAVRSMEEDREREEREKERFGTMNWEFTKRNSTEEEDEIESVEEDLAFEVEEKIAMRDDREEFGTQWRRQEFKAKENERGSEAKEKGNTQGSNTGKCVWETNQRRSLSEFEIKWKDQEHEHEHEQQKEGNSLVVQEDGSGDENELEDSLEVMVNEYVKKREDDEQVSKKPKKNTKRTLSLIDDQVQDMMMKTRPYSPPFGQTLSDENKEDGKWCLDGVKTMKSSEGEDSDKAENKEEVEVVYDPVWKCYYDPKTNSYFELK